MMTTQIIKKRVQPIPEPQHTPEPWGYQVTAFGVTITGNEPTANSIPVGLVNLHPVGHRSGIEIRLPAKRNARRIVAAVNACAGIPTEALEGGLVKELLETCGAFVGFVFSMNNPDLCKDQLAKALIVISDQAIATLAKAKGGK